MVHLEVKSFGSYDEFMLFFKQRPTNHDRVVIAETVKNIKTKGLVDPYYGFVPPSDIEIIGENFRETISYKGLNSRMRAVLLLLSAEKISRGADLNIYACEATTALAKLLQDSEQKFTGSEYIPDPNEAKRKGFRHEDVMRLSFPNNTFDVYLSCEVLEHIPDIQSTLSEAARVLNKNGVAIWTFPFAYGQMDHVVKTTLKNGKLTHLMPPEYHGNPIDPAGGSLVFTIPGWSIIEDAKRAGFSDVEFVFIHSATYGITATHLSGVLVFRARKTVNTKS
jgi:SAM-dependent methyltransferase